MCLIWVCLRWWRCKCQSDLSLSVYIVYRLALTLTRKLDLVYSMSTPEKRFPFLQDEEWKWIFFCKYFGDKTAKVAKRSFDIQNSSFCFSFLLLSLNGFFLNTYKVIHILAPAYHQNGTYLFQRLMDLSLPSINTGLRVESPNVTSTNSKAAVVCFKKNHRFSDCLVLVWGKNLIEKRRRPKKRLLPFDRSTSILRINSSTKLNNKIFYPSDKYFLAVRMWWCCRCEGLNLTTAN